MKGYGWEKGNITKAKQNKTKPYTVWGEVSIGLPLLLQGKQIRKNYDTHVNDKYNTQNSMR